MTASSTDKTDLGSRRGLSCNHRHSETFPGFANWESDLQGMVLFTYTARPPPRDTDQSFRKTMKSLIAIAETGMSLVSQDCYTNDVSVVLASGTLKFIDFTSQRTCVRDKKGRNRRFRLNAGPRRKRPSIVDIRMQMSPVQTVQIFPPSLRS